MLTVGGSFLCRAAADRSLGFCGGDKEGHFCGVLRTSQRRGASLSGIQLRTEPRPQGHHCTPSQRCPAGLDLLTWLTSASPTRHSGIPTAPASHRGLGSRMGPLGTAPLLFAFHMAGFRKRGPLPDVWKLTSECNQIILV